MVKSKKIQEKAINLFFDDSRKFSIPQKETICKQLKISIYDLDRFLDCYYEELEELSIVRLTWCQVYPNSYTQAVKFNFIDSIVKNEHENLIRSQLKETRDIVNLERGEAV